MPGIERSERIDELLEIISKDNVNHIENVLDFGSGNGDICNILKAIYKNVIGLDINIGLLQDAKKKYRDCNLYFYDGINLPFKNEIFDLVVMNDVLEHIDYISINTVIEELIRVLKNDGYIYISVQNKFQIIEPHVIIPFLTWFPRCLRNPICQLLKGKEFIYYYPYTRKILEKFLNKHGLKFTDYTDVYVNHKFNKLDYVDSFFQRSIIKFSKLLKIEKIMKKLGLKVSVLLYLCQKNKKKHEY